MAVTLESPVRIVMRIINVSLDLVRYSKRHWNRMVSCWRFRLNVWQIKYKQPKYLCAMRLSQRWLWKLLSFGIWRLVFRQKLTNVRRSLLASSSVNPEEEGCRFLRNVLKLVPDCSISRVTRQRYDKVYTSDYVLVSYPIVCRSTLQQVISFSRSSVLTETAVVPNNFVSCPSEMLLGYTLLHLVPVFQCIQTFQSTEPR